MTRFRSLRDALPGALLLLGGINAACASPPLAVPPEVEYAGCQSVLLPGPVCVLAESRELRLWVRAPPEAIEIQAGGKRIDTSGEPVQDGQRFSVTVPPGADSADVLVQTQQGRAAWSLVLAEPEDGQPSGPLVRQARQARSRDLLRDVAETARPLHELIARRQLAAAREMLDVLGLPPRAPAKFRYHVAYNRGLLAEKEGDYRSAMAEIQKAVEIAERVKEERYQWLAEEKRALLLRGVGRSRESAELFERLAGAPHPRDSCEVSEFLNNRAWSALLAREAGESFADPTPLLTRALETYETCKRFTPETEVNVLLNLALACLQEGRLPEAKDHLAQVRELEVHATLPHQMWWLDLEARIALGEERPAEALSLFERLEDLALGTGMPDGRLRAAFGQARCHEDLGDRTAALETLSRAEDLLDEQSLQVPLHEGRETFMATRQAVVNLHLELLLAEGRSAEALAAARHARSRMLRQLERSDRLASLAPDRRARWDRLLTDYQQKRASLEERASDDWKLATDQLRRERAARAAETKAAKKLLDEAFLLLADPGEQPGEVLPPPRPGELILAYHPLPGGWVGFAADGEEVAVHRFDLPPGVLSDPVELARLLLLPFRVPIERSERIRVLPSGPLQDVDFHALPFAGDVLLVGRPLVYGLDLPVPSGPEERVGRRALLVTDPRGDLPGTLAEAQTVKDALGAWTITELKTGRASAKAVRDRLATADLLHYAGHGAFSGLGGWESSLLLADDTRLTLGDFLVLERVPAWVVLSGCDTGRSSAETPVENLGLAQAFLLAGSRTVVASIRPADDLEMPGFFSELYRQWGQEPDLAVALQRAQLSWRRRSPRADWAGFRLFEP